MCVCVCLRACVFVYACECVALCVRLRACVFICACECVALCERLRVLCILSVVSTHLPVHIKLARLHISNTLSVIAEMRYLTS